MYAIEPPVPPVASAAALTVSTSSRDDTLKEYSASVCVAGSAIGSFDTRSFFDLDGHGWQVMWMDPAAAEQGRQVNQRG